MKQLSKILTIILTLTLITLPVTKAKAETSSTIPEGLSYKIINNEYVEITYYSGRADNLTIPSQIQGYPVTSIGDRAFVDNRLRTISIPEGVTYIGNEAFLYSSYLREITIPEGVTYLGYRAFAYNYFLETVYLPDSLKTIQPNTFYYNGRLRNVHLPKSLETIRSGAFYNTMILETIKLPSSLKTIESRAFSYSGLRELTLPEGLKHLGDSSFSFCKDLKTEVKIPGGLEYCGTNVFSDCLALKNVVLSEGITTLPYGTFTSCPSLIDVTIPDSLKEISGNAFAGCTTLDKISLPSTLNSVSGDALYPLEKGVIIIRGALDKGELEAYKTLISNGLFDTSTIKFSFLAKEDVNDDGSFDISDLAQIALSYNEKSYTIGFNPDCDLNSDKVIDLYDLVKVAQLL